MTTDYEIMWPQVYHKGRITIKAGKAELEALLKVLELGRESLEDGFGTAGSSKDDIKIAIDLAGDVMYEMRQVIRELAELNAFQ